MFFLLPPNILHQNESKTCPLDFASPKYRSTYTVRVLT